MAEVTARVAEVKIVKPGAERRVHGRLPCELESDCRPAPAVDGAPRWKAVVRDLSTSGIGLLVCRRFEPGTFLTVELPVAGGDAPRVLLARVVRVTQQANATWLLGCELVSRLAEDEPPDLVRGPGRPYKLPPIEGS